MQAIMETLFDAAYLVTVVTLGCIMVKSAQDRETKLFGWMAVILGCGEHFIWCPGPGRVYRRPGGPRGSTGSGQIHHVHYNDNILRYSLPYWKTALWPAHPGADGRRMRAGRGTHRIVPVPAECVAFGEPAAVLGHLGATFRSHCWARWSSWYSCAARGRRGTGPSAGCGWPSCSASRSISRWCCGPTSFRSWACS